MSEHHDNWDPADGPPPTDEERSDARALADRLAHAPGALKRGTDADLDELVATALRVHATAHPDSARAKDVAGHAVTYALTQAGQRWYRSRWRWLALVAAVLLGVGGTQLAAFRALLDDRGASALPITRPAADAFSAPVGEGEGSQPIGRITDSRMRSYRDVLLHARPARRSR